jgi:signal transduction histidine kinase
MASAPGKQRTGGIVGGGLVLGFFVVLAVLLASAVFSLVNGQSVLRDNDAVDHSQYVLQAAVEASADFASTESAARGYILSGIEDFEGEFRRSKPQLFHSIDTMESLTADNPLQQNEVKRLETLAIQRMKDLDEGILRQKQGLPRRSKNDLKTITILATRDEIIKTLGRIKVREQQLMDSRKAQSDNSVTGAYIGLWISSVIGCLVLTGFFAIVVRYVDSIGKLKAAESSRASELEERVRERTVELSAANKDLEAFSYSVSHDLRAPLRAMHGYASILKKESDHLRSDDIRMLDRIQINCTKMSQLIESLLALFRVGKADVMIEEVDLTALAKEVVQDLGTEYSKAPYKIVIQPSMEDLGDRQMLRALLVNLIGNAMKFSESIEQPLISVQAKEENGETVYSIKDNGAGFDQSQAGLLFEPFQRLHKESEFKGNGIGLAMCQKIISRHRGSIWLQSQMGEGTEVFFTLGLRAEEVDAAESRQQAAG